MLNRRIFFKRLVEVVVGISLPTDVLSYCAVQEKVIQPKKKDDVILRGYKGDSFFEYGYVYAPYIPLYVTKR